MKRIIIKKNGRLLIECLKQHHSKCFLKSKVMCNIPIKVSAHTSLNSSKGIIRSRDLEGVSEDEMLNKLSSQGVSAVKRIHIRRNNELVPTNTFILTFCKPLLPDSIKAGQYIFSTWQDDWNGAVANRLHSVKPVLGDSTGGAGRMKLFCVVPAIHI